MNLGGVKVSATEVERAGYRSPTKATHYHASNMSRFPRWVKGMTYLGRKGKHLFYVQK
jgi:spore germination cell wall hydrolase CwlJ-like protein